MVLNTPAVPAAGTAVITWLFPSSQAITGGIEMGLRALNFEKMDDAFQKVFVTRYRDDGFKPDGSFSGEVDPGSAKQIIESINKSWTGPDKGLVLELGVD